MAGGAPYPGSEPCPWREAEGAFDSFSLKWGCFPCCPLAALADTQSWAGQSSGFVSTSRAGEALG